MAIRVRISNTSGNVTLAQRDYANDSAFVARTQAAFPNIPGGATTAEQALALMLAALRGAVRHRAIRDRYIADAAGIAAGQVDEAADFDAEWPV